MINIVVISNKPKAVQLARHFEHLFAGKIDTIDSIDYGLKTVFDKRPCLVFIQGEIAGIPGEKVAHHIKDLLRHDSPRVILLDDAANKSANNKAYFDDTVDLSLPEPELREAFRGHLDRIDGLHWVAAPEGETPLGAQVTDSGASAAKAADVFTFFDEDFSSQAVPLSGVPDPPPLSPVSPHAPDYNDLDFFHASADDVPQEEAAAIEDTPAKPPLVPAAVHAIQTPPQRKLGLQASALILVLSLLVGAAYLVLFSPLGWREKSAGNQHLLSTPSVPSAIANLAADPAYAASHPGWDRYENPPSEYRVYREKGAIKAIQVIDRGGKGVSDSTLSSLLKDTCGTDTCTFSARQVKDNLLVENGLLPNRGEVLVYRRQDSGERVAVVIALP